MNSVFRLSILFKKSLETEAHNSGTDAIIVAIQKQTRQLPTSKVMERILRDSILQHMMTNGHVSDAQHEFVAGRDYMTQLLICIEEWTEMLERSEVFDVVYTDFAKAFDSVPHQRPLLKPQEVGVAGKLLDWIRSFLNGRRKHVRVDGVMSEWIEITSGIPQGSVLRPILFVICINDMPGKVIFNTCKLFADDSKLFGSANMQRELGDLVKWSTKWQPPFNERKCNTLHFGNGNLQLDHQMNGNILEHVNDDKDLRVYTDKDHKFRKHTSVAIKRANQQVLDVIKKSFNTRNSKTISTLCLVNKNIIIIISGTLILYGKLPFKISCVGEIVYLKITSKLIDF